MGIFKRTLTVLAAAITGVALLTGAARSSTKEESLAIRRIVELWKAREYSTAVMQIRDFSQRYPESQFLDSFLVLQGDLDWKERRYQEALHAYNSIRSEELRKQVLPHRLDALYYTKNYEELAKTLDAWVPTVTSPTAQDQRWLFYYAECLANEESSARLQQAETLYRQLLTSSYKTQAQFGLAQVYARTGKAKEAADLYLQLAEGLPEKRDLLLYKAAQLQATYDKELATQTYSELQKGTGSTQLAAAFGEILLLQQSEQHEALIKLAKELETSLPQDQIPLLHFFAGRSEFALRHYEKAIDQLQPLLNNPDNANRRVILTTLIASAQQLHQLDRVEKWVANFEKDFPNDPQTPKVRLLRALAYKDAGKNDESLDILRKLIRDYPGFDEISTAYLEEGLLLFKQERWADSRKALLAFIERFPDSPQVAAAQSIILQSTVKQLQAAETNSPAADLLRQQLTTDLLQLIQEGKGSEPQLLRLLAKTYIESGDPQQAMKVLKEVLQKFPNDSERYQTYLLLAFCCYANQADVPSFITYAEKALDEKPQFPERSQLHNALFSAYLQQGKGPDNESKAAEHLYLALSEDIPAQNREWLANYFYRQLARSQTEWLIQPLNDPAERELATKTLKVLQPIASDQDALYELSNVYGWLGETDEQRAILEKLPESAPARLALANLYLAEGNSAEALQLYRSVLEARKTPSDSAARAYATLQDVRLRLESEDITQALQLLSELQNQRIADQEPLHLEAAVERARLLGKASPEAEVEALKQAKRAFAAKDDIQARDYHTSLAKNPHKQLMVEAYTTLMDARIAALEAQMAEDKGNKPEANQKRDAAKSLYKMLKTGKLAITPYVIQAASKAMN